LLCAAAPSAARGGPNPLPKADQKKVNDAIDLGVRYLKLTQSRWGTWTLDKDNYPVGYAALPGLTLLECGEEATDPAVKQAALFVRSGCAKVDRTYEIALAILFLDRLGDKKDRKIIQMLALRLIAGQTPTGGWSYKCPILNARAHSQLLAVLQKLNPTPPPEAKGGAGADKPAAKKKPPKVAIPANLRALSVLRDPSTLILKDPPDRLQEPFFGTTDNSNTQFAILALWAARRHGVPMERSMKLMVRRYHTSQKADGGWAYRYTYGGGEGGGPAMNAVGLLGLAVGHGLAGEGRKGKPVNDPSIVKGFVALARHIGEPAGRMKDLPMANLYFLWSVERVGVLYDLATVGKKDWYCWGAEILVANQKGDGNWDGGGYPGASKPLDTCLALLFLKRANLARDLTEKLPFDPKHLSKEIEQKLPPSTVAKPPESVKQPDPPANPKSPDQGISIKPPPDATAPPPSSTALPNDVPAEEDQGGSGLIILGGLGVVVLLGLGAALYFVCHGKTNGESSPDRRGRSRKGTAAFHRDSEEEAEEEEERGRKRRRPSRRPD
jgi:hypothetical protein